MEELLAALQKLKEQGWEHYTDLEERATFSELIWRVSIEDPQKLDDLHLRVGFIGGKLQATQYIIDALRDNKAPLAYDNPTKYIRRTIDEPWKFIKTTLPGNFWFLIIGEEGKTMQHVLLVGKAWYEKYT